MATAMKFLLKKNAAANRLELWKRLQGLTATDIYKEPGNIQNNIKSKELL